MSDEQIDPVYVSHLLSRRHPGVFAALATAFGDRIREIPNTKDIWCRDYMPVPVGHGQYVQFRYAPDYLRGYSELRTGRAHRLLELAQCRPSRIVLDGGNVVRQRNVAILTDKPYAENRAVERRALRERLRGLLRVERLVIVPKEPYDPLGHTDGMLRPVDERTLLVNDYRTTNPAFGEQLEAVLRRAGFDLIPIPYRPAGCRNPSSGLPTAHGVYVNFVRAGGVLLHPLFGRREDDRAAAVLERTFPRDRLVSVRCEALASEGGGLHCVTWSADANDGG